LFTSWSLGVGRGHNRENYIYIYIEKKIFFSRTSWPITIKLGINHSWVQGILNCSNKGPGPLQRADNKKKCKNGMGSFKNLLQNHWARLGHIYMKAFKKQIYWQCDLMAIKKSNVACVHRQNISQYDSGEWCGPWAYCFFFFFFFFTSVYKGNICKRSSQEPMGP
jgi:hypothetical protein